MAAKGNGAAGLSRDHRSAAEDKAQDTTPARGGTRAARISRRERRMFDRRALRLEHKLTGLTLDPAFDRRAHVLVAGDTPRSVVFVADRQRMITFALARGLATIAEDLLEPPRDPLSAHLVLFVEKVGCVVERRVLPMAAGGAA